MKLTKFFSLMMGLLAAILLVVAYLRGFSGDVVVGQRLAQNNCGICHDLTSKSQHAKGPYLWGIFNRRAGATDFPYSPAFISATQMRPIDWNSENLDTYIANPVALIPETQMVQETKSHPISYHGISDATNRMDLIAYLKTLHDE
ncbi:MAG: c-type cytochrome [Magnetococcus sp. DMHC-6]